MGRKSHCKRGHPLSGDNLYEYDDGQRVFRSCRTCRREHNRRSRQKRRKPPNLCNECGRPAKKHHSYCRACKADKKNYKIRQVDRKYIYSRDGQCLNCGTKDSLTIDHILPRALGGGDNRENLQTLCRDCNLEKSATYIDYRPDSDGQLALALAPPAPISTFEERVAEKTTPRGGCSIWTGATLSSGTPAMKVDGKTTTAKRHIYERHHGSIPDGLWIYSTCGNTACVAAEHLLAAPPGRQADGAPHPSGRSNGAPHFNCGHRRHPSNIRRSGTRLRCRECKNRHSRNYVRRQARDNEAA